MNSKKIKFETQNHEIKIYNFVIIILSSVHYLNVMPKILDITINIKKATKRKKKYIYLGNQRPKKKIYVDMDKNTAEEQCNF